MTIKLKKSIYSFAVENVIKYNPILTSFTILNTVLTISLIWGKIVASNVTLNLDLRYLQCTKICLKNNYRISLFIIIVHVYSFTSTSAVISTMGDLYCLYFTHTPLKIKIKFSLLSLQCILSNLPIKRGEKHFIAFLIHSKVCRQLFL